MRVSGRSPRLMLGAATFALVVSTISPAVSSLHREAKVVDLHSDTLLDVASGKRDISRRGTAGHIDLPRLREGGVDVQVFAAFIHPREAERGFERALELLDAFDRMVSSHADVLGRALTFADIEQLERSGKVAAVLSIESGDAVQGNPANVDRLYRRGVRIMSLTWNNSTGLADGALEQRHGGLTPVGRRVLARMAALGIIVDVSHLSAKSFWDVL
ncbi:MAG: dipeptidase, partial [bacterium]